LIKYIQHYSKELQEQVQVLIDTNALGGYLLNKYPDVHEINSDKALFSYTNEIKNRFMKKSSPLSKAVYDAKVNDVYSALGTHRFISRVQGGKLKAKNEIHISTMFKQVPEAFLEMIVVHELAHFKEKEHNKAFYKLCVYMQSDYHQRELDLRLYLIYLDRFGKLYNQ
jgi:UTP pyrophosphatase